MPTGLYLSILFSLESTHCSNDNHMQMFVGRKQLLCDKPKDHLHCTKEATTDYGTCTLYMYCNLLELIDHIKDPPIRASKAVANSVTVNGVQYRSFVMVSVTLVVFTIFSLTSITEVPFLTGITTSL